MFTVLPDIRQVVQTFRSSPVPSHRARQANFFFEIVTGAVPHPVRAFFPGCRHGVNTPWERLRRFAILTSMNTLLIIIVLLLLFGGGGFYFGGPGYGGGGLGLVLLICLIIFAMGGFRGRK
jgi:hypothetical protein